LHHKELKITADGSHTIFVEELNETYHSKHGAIREAVHVFIQAGLNHLNQSKIKVLEIGFGTGLNVFLTLLESCKRGITVDYTSLEAFPLENKIISQLNYTTELGASGKEIEWFRLLHGVEWESAKRITEGFSLNKLKTTLINFETIEQYDLIFFDAFGPKVQPEMWSEAIFEKMYKCLAKDGVLVTYCAKGSVKRGLKSVGFTIESLPGPPGKREMTRALKL